VYEFPVDRPVTASIKLRCGTLRIVAEECTAATVEVAPDDGSDASREAAERTRVELRDDALLIEAPDIAGGWLWRRGGRVRVTARVPLDSTLNLKVAAADAEIHGRWREAQIHSASGSLDIGHITNDIGINSASGDVRVLRVDGDLKLNSASGDIAVGAVGGTGAFHSASGDITVDDAGSSISARTASGDVTVRRARRGDFRVQTASGTVTIGVVSGTGVYLDVSTLSGSTYSDLDVGASAPEGKGAELSMHVRTVSGDVAVLRAEQKAAAKAPQT